MPDGPKTSISELKYFSQHMRIQISQRVHMQQARACNKGLPAAAAAAEAPPAAAAAAAAPPPGLTQTDAQMHVQTNLRLYSEYLL